MARIKWDVQTGERRYEYGVDRGLVFFRNGNVVPWNGLTQVVLKKTTDLVTPVHYEGRRFDLVDKRPEISATVSAVTYPEEIELATGFDENEQGVLLDEQPLEYFTLSYRTMAEDGNYKVNVLFDCKAVPIDTTHSTVQSVITPYTFGWEVQATPRLVAGKLTSRAVLDTRTMPISAVKAAEDILYGTPTSIPNLHGFMQFLESSEIGYMTHTVTDHGNGTWSIDTSDYYVSFTGGMFSIDDVDATYLDEYTYEVQSSQDPVR